MPNVSVIIPTHNRSSLIAGAIDSVYNQTEQDFEIIVVDDGSADDTPIIMDKLQKQDKSGRLKYFRLDRPHGANFARNYGIERATGEFIAFLDDDDRWRPNKLESQLVVFESDKSIGLVYTGKEMIYEELGLNYCSTSRKQGDMSRDILIGNFIGSTSSVMIRNYVLDKSGMFDIDLPAKQDYDLWIRICQSYKVGVVPKPLVLYYIRNINRISSDLDKRRRAESIINEKYKELTDSLVLSNQEKSDIELRKLLYELKFLKESGNSVVDVRRRLFGKIVSKHMLRVLFILTVSYIPLKYWIRFKSFQQKMGSSSKPLA